MEDANVFWQKSSFNISKELRKKTEVLLTHISLPLNLVMSGIGIVGKCPENASLCCGMVCSWFWVYNIWPMGHWWLIKTIPVIYHNSFLNPFLKIFLKIHCWIIVLKK